MVIQSEMHFILSYCLKNWTTQADIDTLRHLCDSQYQLQICRPQHLILIHQLLMLEKTLVYLFQMMVLANLAYAKRCLKQIRVEVDEEKRRGKKEKDERYTVDMYLLSFNYHCNCQLLLSEIGLAADLSHHNTWFHKILVKLLLLLHCLSDYSIPFSLLQHKNIVLVLSFLLWTHLIVCYLLWCSKPYEQSQS